MNGLFLPKTYGCGMETERNGTKVSDKIEWSGWMWPGQLAEYACVCVCVSRVERCLKCQVECGVVECGVSECSICLEPCSIAVVSAHGGIYIYVRERSCQFI